MPEPVDHILMMRIARQCIELGDLLVEFTDRLTPEQRVDLAGLLPIYSQILLQLGHVSLPENVDLQLTYSRVGRGFDA